MTHDRQKNATCPICNLEEAQPAFRLARGEVLACRSCGIFFVANVSDAHTKGFYLSVDEASYVSYFENFRKGQYRKVLQQLGLSAGQTLLDVGASYGWMLEVGAEFGLDAHGVEPGNLDLTSSPVAKRIFAGTLDEYAAQAGRDFDVVTMWHVLEHLSDPREAVSRIASLLKPGGKCVIAVPNAHGRMFRLAVAMKKHLRFSRLIDELFYADNPNMHLFYYSEASLQRLLTDSVLKIRSVQTLDAFDWKTMHKRAGSRSLGAALMAAGPFIHASKFTSAENLVVIGEKSGP